MVSVCFHLTSTTMSSRLSLPSRKRGTISSDKCVIDSKSISPYMSGKKASINSAKKVSRSRLNIKSCFVRSEEHTSELQSRGHLVCRLLLEKKKKYIT